MEKEQIIKALECCMSSNSLSACMHGCPLYEKEDCECVNDGTAILKYALALIKQQDEQIFQLENRLKECENGYAGTGMRVRFTLKGISFTMLRKR